MLHNEDFTIVHELAATLQAFADPVRLKIVRLLTSKTRDTLSVTDVSKILGISQPAASQHIKTLKSIGILKQARDGNRMLYTVNYPAVYRFKEVWDDMYSKMFTICPHDMQCRECPDRKTCA
jgi:ArsR family transcriptional regulator, arsenate/arsenite/antimonite-responsive transcriptional repressor